MIKFNFNFNEWNLLIMIDFCFSKIKFNIVLSLYSLSLACSPSALSLDNLNNGFPLRPPLGMMDSDNDGITDLIETDEDFDNDGIPNYLDEDSDGDGYLDRNEILEPIILFGRDYDDDGIDDGYDVDSTHGDDKNNNGIDDKFDPVDSDFDEIPDFLDRDSDNDGVPDALEHGWFKNKLLNENQDLDSLENRLDTDSDNDGIGDLIEFGFTKEHAHDSDGDQIIDEFDATNTSGVDKNHDGIDDRYRQPDFDNDGLPNFLDLDSDNDGVHDITESGQYDEDTDGIKGDLRLVFFHPLDHDKDGLPTFLDLDQHGVIDLPEAFNKYDSDNNGQIDLEFYQDQDWDGIPDVIDHLPGKFGNFPTTNDPNNENGDTNSNPEPKEGSDRNSDGNVNNGNNGDITPILDGGKKDLNDKKDSGGTFCWLLSLLLIFFFRKTPLKPMSK